MRKKMLLVFLLVLLFSLSVFMVVTAQVGSGFDLSWNVVNGGAARSEISSGYVLYSTVGQTATGESSGSGVEMSHGFWQTFIDVLYNRLPLAVKH